MRFDRCGNIGVLEYTRNGIYAQWRIRSRVANDVEAAGSHRKSRGRPVPRCESVPAYRSHNRQPGRSTRPDFTAESRRGRWSVARYRPRSIDARGTLTCRYPLSVYARPIVFIRACIINHAHHVDFSNPLSREVPSSSSSFSSNHEIQISIIFTVDDS